MRTTLMFVLGTATASLGCLLIVTTPACTPAAALNAGLVSVQGDQERQCVDRYSPDATAEKECRDGINATWEAYWAKQYPDSGLFDAGKE